MAYEDAPGGREGADGLDVDQGIVTEMSVFGAHGGSEELLATYHATVDHNHERPALEYQGPVEDFWELEPMSPTPNRENYHGVDGQGAAREWQSGAMISRLDNPEWKHIEGIDPRLYKQADGTDSTLATPYNGKQPWLVNRSVSGPWNALVSQGMMEDQSTLDVLTKSYDQPYSFQRWSESSFESAPSRLDEGNSCYAESSTEVSGQPSHSNLSNVPGHRQGQQRLLTPTYAQNFPLAADMSRVPSQQKEERGYCLELGCRAKFKGFYAKGNLARHRRLKHGSHQGQEVREYICEESGCPKSYKRQDARVKHYRKHHQHLAPGPALSRKKYRSV